MIFSLILALSGAPESVPAHQQALSLVKSLYTTEASPSGRRATEAVFSADLARAMIKDGSTPDEVGAIDFDWRYGAQDTEIKGLDYRNMEGPRSATIWVSFTNFGKPATVVYELCHAERGWRVSDVHSQGGDDRWDLRKMLKLPKKVRC